MSAKTCAICEGPVAAAGRKSKTGIYYCSKVDCRRERDRIRVQKWRQDHAAPDYPTTENIRDRINREIREDAERAPTGAR